MKLLNFAALLVLGLSGVQGECIRNGVRCLEYSVLNTYENYEERAYPAIVWVSASAEGEQKTDVSRSLIKLLYAYIGGANTNGSTLDMMVPVRTTKLASGNTNRYTMSLALLPEQSEDPPKPINPNVTVFREPETTYVARSFGGQARSDSVWNYQADILKTAFENDPSVETSFYYMAVYDSPWRETDRLNEVWMKKA